VRRPERPRLGAARHVCTEGKEQNGGGGCRERRFRQPGLYAAYAPIISRTFPLEGAQEAHALLRQNGLIGLAALMLDSRQESSFLTSV
jgi:hypothetical protein